MKEYLKKYQILYIDDEKFTVENMIEFEEGTWKWQEYEITGEKSSTRWLSVEINENNETEYYLYKNFYGSIDSKELEFFAEGQRFQQYEKGVTTVKDYFGNADVDRYEKCDYIDYISEDENTIISIENWSGEKEVTIGTYIDSSRIRIIDEIDQPRVATTRKYKSNTKLITIIIYGIFLLPVILALFSMLFSGLFVNKSIEKYLSENTTKYTYVTSITSNIGDKIAKVYKATSTSLDTVVKDIIDGVPEGITKTGDLDETTEEDGIGLETDDEYAFIYKEGGNIYIQVSDKEYIENNGSTYHSRHRNYYYRTYRESKTSSKYNTYWTSAKQSSINSRTSSGGGTSFGK